MFSGCATIISGSSQSLSVSSNVSGAKVYIDEEFVGNTPLLITDLKRSKKNKLLTIEKEGYQTSQILLESTVNSVFWVNIFSGGAAFGSTTDYASESMFKYADSNIVVDLVKKN